MPDKIQWRRSAQQDGVEQGCLPDPKKLVINRQSYMYISPVMFSIRNENLQRISEFDIEPGWDYPLDNSLKKYSPAKNGTNSDIEQYPDMLGCGFLFYNKNDIKIGMVVNAESGGELYVRGNDYNTYETSLDTNKIVYKLAKGINNIATMPFNKLAPLNFVACFASNVKCHVSNCYIYYNSELDHYIEPKVYQDVVLEYCFNDHSDAKCIKHNGSNWVDDTGYILSEHDQQQLNSIKFVDGCIIQSYNNASPVTLQLTFDISE